MTAMERCLADARRLLRSAADALELTAPDPVPLRLGAEAGVLVSALPRRLGAETGGDAQTLARALAARLTPEDAPFDRTEAENGLLLLFLSEDWFCSVLEEYRAQDWPSPPALPAKRSEDDAAFLLAYTVRRCRVLAERGADISPAYPAELLCALASGAPGERIARLYWHLPAEVRAYPPLAKAVGIAAGRALDAVRR